jgi:hypothetical protein
VASRILRIDRPPQPLADYTAVVGFTAPETGRFHGMSNRATVTAWEPDDLFGGTPGRRAQLTYHISRGDKVGLAPMGVQ